MPDSMLGIWDAATEKARVLTSWELQAKERCPDEQHTGKGLRGGRSKVKRDRCCSGQLWERCMSIIGECFLAQVTPRLSLERKMMGLFRRKCTSEKRNGIERQCMKSKLKWLVRMVVSLQMAGEWSPLDPLHSITGVWWR